jgi:hypothetical protein
MVVENYANAAGETQGTFTQTSYVVTEDSDAGQPHRLAEPGAR